MIYKISLSILFISLTLLTNAQSSKKHLTAQNAQQSAKQESDSLSIKLKLSSPQKKSIDSLERIFLEQRVALGNQLTAEERVSAIGKVQQEKARQLQRVLSAEQYRQYLQLIEERKKLVESKQKELRERNKNQ